MIVKTLSGMQTIDAIVEGLAVVKTSNGLNIGTPVLALPSTKLAIYHYYPNGDFMPANYQRALKEKFKAVVVEGEYSAENLTKAKNIFMEVQQCRKS